MRVNYINYNGKLLADSKALLSIENRAFRYGDGLFETMLWSKGQIRLLQYHMDRLQSGMQTLQLEGHQRFDAAKLTELSAALLAKNELSDKTCRLRLQVFRAGGGLYSPINNHADYLLEAIPLEESVQINTQRTGLSIDVYPDHFKAVNGLSNLKSTNSQVFVLAGLYRKKKGLDEVILLNQEGMICESISANVFVSYQKQLFTPALSEGCVAGTMRRAVLELAETEGITITEAQIDPQILEEADEVFLTNAIRGVQWVMGYRKKRYFNHWSKRFQTLIAECQLGRTI